MDLDRYTASPTISILDLTLLCLGDDPEEHLGFKWARIAKSDAHPGGGDLYRALFRRFQAGVMPYSAKWEKRVVGGDDRDHNLRVPTDEGFQAARDLGYLCKPADRPASNGGKAKKGKTKASTERVVLDVRDAVAARKAKHDAIVPTEVFETVAKKQSPRITARTVSNYVKEWEKRTGEHIFPM